MNDYERIVQLVQYVDENPAQANSAGEMAIHLGWSLPQLHSLFSSWAGVTVQDFLNALNNAKPLLPESSLMDVKAADGGFISSVRVQFESPTTSDAKSDGKRWTIQHGFCKSPFGECLIAECPEGICHLSFVENENRSENLKTLREEWPQAELLPDNKSAERLASEIFSRPSIKADASPIRAFVGGTLFQSRVWNALLRIPSGCLTSYGRLAAAIGNPAAARAVGTAVGQNPLAYLIPCHRVIRESGQLGEYRWGRLRKRVIVAWETVQGIRWPVENSD